MSRVITIDSTVVLEENEIIEHFTRNDELESVEITIKNTTQLEPYDMGLQTTIVEDGNTDYYITGADDVVRTAIGYYNHRITLIEAYKIFEREVTASLQYTQALDTTTYTCLDVVDRGLKLLNIEKTSDLGGTRKYDISGLGTRDSSDDYVLANLSGFAEALYNKKAPEIQYNTPSLREQFDEVFLLFDGRPVLENFTTINIKYYNEDNNEITITTVDEITGHQDIEKNAQKFDIYMENAVSENNVNKQARVYPSTTAWGSVRSSETELTTENFLMEVNEDIERVLEFKIYADVEVDYFNSGGTATQFSGEIEVDMTDWLFTERARKALDFNYSNLLATGYPSGQFLNNSLYFSGNQIKGWNDEIDVFSAFTTVKLWHLFIATACVEGSYIPSTAQSIRIATTYKPEFNTNVRDFMFRLKYVPKEVVRVQLERDADVGFGTLRANQTARIVDAELLANNMQSKLNRDGNKELKFSKLVEAYASAFDVRDYYGTYKGTKVDNTRYSNGQTLSTITLSEHYSKKSERIDIANKPRQTEISPVNTIRNDIINEYIKVGSTGDDASGSLNENGLERYSVTFDDTFTPTYPVEFANWESDLIIEATTQGIGKTMSFKFEFPDNISAGTQTAALDTIYGNKIIPYAGASGIIDNATIKFYGNFSSAVNTFAAKALVAQALPEYQSGTSAGDVTFGTNSLYIDLDERRILKDSGEVYAMSYQLTHYTDDDDIFIGNKLAQENALVVKDTEDLYLYSTLDTFVRGQNIDVDGAFVSKQKIVTGTPLSSSQVKIVSTVFGTTDKFVKFEFTTNFNTGRHWAICNEIGEVYIIMYKTDQEDFYIVPQETRS